MAIGFFRFFGHNSNGQAQLPLKDIFSGVNYDAAAQPASQIGWALFRDKITPNPPLPLLPSLGLVDI
jgi:hypothetical protein